MWTPHRGQMVVSFLRKLLSLVFKNVCRGQELWTKELIKRLCFFLISLNRFFVDYYSTSSRMSASITTDILGAVADLRTRDLRFRQRQLIALHTWISKNIAELKRAFRADDGLSDPEAQFILSMALDDLRRNYDSLDLKKELDIEFRIKNGRDNEQRRVPEDIVYVVPDSFTLFYGVTSALCASVAAGSCCIVEVCACVSSKPQSNFVTDSGLTFLSCPTT